MTEEATGRMSKTYLGDSVYAEWDEFNRLVLTIENGYGPSNTIVLEPEVLDALVRVADARWERPDFGIEESRDDDDPCPVCGGAGFRIVCPDDVCRGAEECRHGADGYKPCPKGCDM